MVVTRAFVSPPHPGRLPRVGRLGLFAVWLTACVPAASDGGNQAPASSGGNGGHASGAGGNSAGSGGSNAGTGGSNAGTGGARTGTGGTSGGGGSTPGAGGSASGTGGSAAVDAGGSDSAAALPGYAFCLPCHGPDGQGVAKMGPEILHPVVDYGVWLVRNGRANPAYATPMPKLLPDQITDDQLKAIWAFLAAPPKPTTGEGLFKDFCAHCHGDDAKGGPTMRDISTKPMGEFMTKVRNGTHPGEYANRREYMPKWSAAEISDADIRSIFMYVDGL